MRVAEDVVAQQPEMPLELRRRIQVRRRVVEVRVPQRGEGRIFTRPELVQHPRGAIGRIRAFEEGGRGSRFHGITVTQPQGLTAVLQ